MLEAPVGHLAALDACEAVLQRRPSALLVDVDGTISPIVADPLAAIVLPGCRAALASLSSRLDLVGVLSGRAPDQAYAMVALDALEYWGGHGVTHLAQGVLRTAPEAEKFMATIGHLVTVIEGWDLLPGMFIEPKSTSVALHYRATADPPAAREWLYGRLAPLGKPNGLDLLEGRMVFELRPPGLGKGWCIQRVIHERGLGGVVYVGDDLTDMEAFAAIDTWRAAGPDRTAVTVAVDNAEAATRIPLTADFAVEGVHAVEWLLAGLAERFTGLSSEIRTGPRT